MRKLILILGAIALAASAEAAQAAVVTPEWLSPKTVLKDNHKGPGETGEAVWGWNDLSFEDGTVLSAEFVGGWWQGAESDQGFMSIKDRFGKNHTLNKHNSIISGIEMDSSLSGHGGTNWLYAWLGHGSKTSGLDLVWLPREWGGYSMFDARNWGSIIHDGYSDFDDLIVKFTDESWSDVPPAVPAPPAAFLMLGGLGFLWRMRTGQAKSKTLGKRTSISHNSFHA